MDILQTIEEVAKGASNLRVITIVGDAAVAGSIESPTVTMPEKGPSMVTNLNIVGGDISTVVSEPFNSPGYADLRNLHNEMLAKAQDVVARNIAILKDVAEWLGKSAPSGTPSK